MARQIEFAIEPDLDASRLAQCLERQGRIRIPGFLASAAADDLRADLQEAADWRRVIKGGEQVFEAPSDAIEAMAESERAALDQAIFREAARGFRFRYDTIRVPDEDKARQNRATALSGFARFMSSPAMLDFFRRVTGCGDIVFADAQATRYRPGDFLTRHDDAVTGKHRSHAYVLGLSPDWPPEWGGLLLFNGTGNDIVEAMTPDFNSLDLFAVGQSHSVSYVAPYAQRDRISVTGWLRTAKP